MGDHPDQPIPPRARCCSSSPMSAISTTSMRCRPRFSTTPTTINAGLVSAYGRIGWAQPARARGWRLKARNYLYPQGSLTWAAADTTQTHAIGQQQVTQLPPWINDAAQQNYAFAQNVAMQPLQQYQGQMVADVGPQMQQAWNTAATGGNAGQDSIQRGAGRLSRRPDNAATQVTPQQLAGHQSRALHEPVHAGRDQQDAADHAAAAGAVAEPAAERGQLGERLRRLAPGASSRA